MFLIVSWYRDGSAPPDFRLAMNPRELASAVKDSEMQAIQIFESSSNIEPISLTHNEAVSVTTEGETK